MPQLQIQGMAYFLDLAACHRFSDCAARLGGVMAIGEAAMSKMRRKLTKSALQHALGQVMQAKFLKARRVNH